MNCEELRERLGDPTTLPAVETDDEAMRHIAGCEPCRAWLAYEKQLTGGFEQMGNRRPPVALADRIIAIPAEERRRTAARTPWWLAWWRRSWWPAALAGGVVGLFLAVSVSWLTPSSPQSRPTLQLPPAPMALARREEAAKGEAPALTDDLPAPAAKTMQEDAGTALEETAPAGAGIGAPPGEPRASTSDADSQPGRPPQPAVAMMAAAPADEAPASTEGATAVFQVARIDPHAADLDAETLLPPPAVPLSIPRPTAPPPPPPAPALPARRAPLPALPARGAPLPNETTVRQPVALDSARVPAAPPQEAATFDAGSLPIVRGDPLDDDTLRPRPLPMTRAAAPPTTKSRLHLAPVGPTDPFSPKVRSGPSAARGEMLLAKGAGETMGGTPDRESASESETKGKSLQLAKAEPFAPPPPAAAPARPTLAFKKEMAPARSAGLPRDDRHAKVEAILEAHSRDIREGPIDINHWVITDWISVKERIFLAPPPGYHWVATRRGPRWEASLQKISGP